MKRLRFSALFLGILMLLISSCRQPPIEVPLPLDTPGDEEQAPTDTPIVDEPPPMEEQCLDFLGFQDGSTFGQAFMLEGVQFSGLGTRDLSVMEAVTSVHGLVFDEGGIQIDLPGPSSAVVLTIGAWFPQPLEITAFDDNGNIVDQAIDPADNSLHTYSLGGGEITSLVITGGGGEGVLVGICIEVVPEPLTDEQCLDFLGFQDGATLGQAFELEAILFSALGTRELSVMEAVTGVHGLVFDEGGIQIDLPGPSSAVVLTIGAWFPQPLEITAFDDNGNIVDQTIDPADNSLHTYSLGGWGDNKCGHHRRRRGGCSRRDLLGASIVCIEATKHVIRLIRQAMPNTTRILRLL